MTGATPPTIIIRLNARAAALPDARSAMIALPITMPAAPATPWANLAPISTSMVGAKTVVALATTHTAAPTSIGRTRPNRSESGPNSSCPAARPSRNAVSVSCTAVAEVCRSPTMVGNAGR